MSIQDIVLNNMIKGRGFLINISVNDIPEAILNYNQIKNIEEEEGKNIYVILTELVAEKKITELTDKAIEEITGEILEEEFRKILAILIQEREEEEEKEPPIELTDEEKAEKIRAKNLIIREEIEGSIDTENLQKEIDKIITKIIKNRSIGKIVIKELLNENNVITRSNASRNKLIKMLKQEMEEQNIELIEASNLLDIGRVRKRSKKKN